MSVRFVIAFLALLLVPAGAHSSEQSVSKLEIWKSPSCGCCGKWVDHMKASGYETATNDVAHGVLAKIKRQAGVQAKHASCHTAKVGGYFIEGHVPAADVARLLKERPDALGLAVPGMPIGSPGMEVGNEKEPYEVLLVHKDGSTEVFARHGQ